MAVKERQHIYALQITWLLFLLETDVPCADNLDFESSLAEVEAQLHFAILRACNVHNRNEIDTMEAFSFRQKLYIVPKPF